MKKLFNLKNSLIAVLVVLAVLGGVSFAPTQTKADFYFPANHFEIPVNEGGSHLITVEPIAESLSDSGRYSVSYKFSQDAYRVANAPRDVSFSVHALLHKCPEGNGNDRNLYCWQTNYQTEVRTISLNASNNWTQEVAYAIQQDPAVPCGAFQTDLYAPNPTTFDEDPNLRAASIYRTGRDLNTCVTASPSPSPSASPSPSPSVVPSPSPSASTIQCEAGQISKVVDSTIICVAQNQEQEQEQEQNNDQNQNVDQNVVAIGGNSSSSSSSNSSSNVTINFPSPTPTATPTTTVVSVPQVVMQTKGDIQQLPKTGLPLAAMALGGLLPGGMAFKRFGKKPEEVSANSIWTEKQLNS